MTDLKSAIYGAVIGDAIGVPYEFLLRDKFNCTNMSSGGFHNQPKGTWSDDSAMMLGTCDSIRLHHGKIDVSDIRTRFVQWMNHGEYTCDGTVFDIGQTVLRALARGRGLTGERSNGNGSLMRILPLAFTSATDEEIEAVSAITHAHAISCQACVAYVHIARDLRRHVPLMDAIRAHLPEHSVFSRLPYIKTLDRDQIESAGYVLHTLEAALWCLANTTTYRDCILTAVNLGSDTDTTACVAGGLAGIIYGMSGIPADWIDGLRSKDLLDGWLFDE